MKQAVSLLEIAQAKVPLVDGVDGEFVRRWMAGSRGKWMLYTSPDRWTARVSCSGCRYEVHLLKHAGEPIPPWHPEEPLRCRCDDLADEEAAWRAYFGEYAELWRA